MTDAKTIIRSVAQQRHWMRLTIPRGTRINAAFKHHATGGQHVDVYMLILDGVRWYVYDDECIGKTHDGDAVSCTGGKWFTDECIHRRLARKCGYGEQCDCGSWQKRIREITDNDDDVVIRMTQCSNCYSGP